jgi:hypothetical protein
MKLNTGIILLLALGLFLGVAVSELQSRRINNLQTQIDELRIIVDQKFLPAMILDNHNLTVQ